MRELPTHTQLELGGKPIDGNALIIAAQERWHLISRR